MTTHVSLSHNIGDVISDIGDVKDDLNTEMRKRVGAAMRVLWADVRQYVLDDPHAGGDLFRAIERDIEDDYERIEFSVYTDPDVAPYATVTEYGSGRRREVSGPGAKPFPPIGPDEQKPPDYPYTAPDVDDIRGFAWHIENWMIEKGLAPRGGSLTGSAYGIAKTIVRKGTYAHPYMRPAWFDNELKVKRAARNAVKNATR